MKRARKQDDDFLSYDEVWAMFDRDDHLRFPDACKMAKDNQIELAVSNPCFELWLLLHLRDSPGARDRCDIRKMVRQHLPGYDKHIDYDKLAEHVDQAVERARRLDADAQRMGEAFRNPTTGVYRLIESIARTDDSPAPDAGSEVPGDHTSKAKGSGRRQARKARG